MIGIIAKYVALFATVIGLVLFVDFLFYKGTDEHKAVQAAKSLGLKDIQVVDKKFLWPFNGCAKSDNALFTVEGTDPSGAKQKITVCAGLFKGGTIRYM